MALCPMEKIALFADSIRRGTKMKNVNSKIKGGILQLK